jgi:hypothetical protein
MINQAECQSGQCSNELYRGVLKSSSPAVAKVTIRLRLRAACKSCAKHRDNALMPKNTILKANHYVGTRVQSLRHMRRSQRQRGMPCRNQLMSRATDSCQGVGPAHQQASAKRIGEEDWFACGRRFSHLYGLATACTVASSSSFPQTQHLGTTSCSGRTRSREPLVKDLQPVARGGLHSGCREGAIVVWNLETGDR